MIELKMRTLNLKLIALFVLLWCFTEVGAQTKFTLSGEITDAETGEALVGASIAVFDTPHGAVANNYGFYSLTLRKNTYRIVVSYVGYEDLKQEIELSEDQKINFSLSPKSREIKEVVVHSGSNVGLAQMSKEHLNMKQVESIPVLLGEKDILKTIQLLPGISTVSEGSSGFSVRGGSFDQNMILLDEAPVYSASHLLGFFSVLNSDALNDISVYKGGIPAEYGGRASSVLNINMKEGNNKSFSASGGIGLISSRLTLEGPIGKNERTSFIISGRRSYADWVAKGAGILDNDMTLYFYDLNAKVNHKINDNNRLYLSGYFGKDDFGYEDMATNWGNKTATLRWNHIWNNQIFSNTSLIYSNYDYGFNITDEVAMESGIVDVGLKHDFSFYKSPENTMKFGFNTTFHTFNPGELVYEDVDANGEQILEQKQGLESAIYFSNYRKFSNKFSLDYGLRLSMFNQFGQGWQNSYNLDNTKTDSIWFGSGELMQTYFEYEPRLSFLYRLNDRNSMKISYNRMAQYMHLISNSTSGQPTDAWYPSTNNIEPLIASQIALGYTRSIKDGAFELSLESYYKDLENVTDYEDGTDILLNQDIEAQILSGDGRSYGLEVNLKKNTGRFTGWISYTLSRTENKIDGINSYDWYPTRNDKKHDIAVVGNYRFTDRVCLSANWIFYTGNAVTFPSGQYLFDGQSWPYYSERNGYRMPNYHRLDFNLHIDGKKQKRFQSSWDISLYNVYNRYNAYTITFGESESVPGTNEATKLSLFGAVPSVTWNFKF